MNDFNKTLLICWFGVFCTSLGLSQLAPILPLFIRSLGVNEFDDIAFYSGLCFGITSLLMAAFSPIWGVLTNKLGCKIMLLRASLGMAILTFLLAFVQNVEQIIIIRALTGIVSGFISSAIVFIALISPKNKAATALTTLSTASVSGNLIGPLFGGLLSEFFGIKNVFIIIALLLFISFLTILVFIKEKKLVQTKIKSQNTKLNLKLILILFSMTFIIQFGFNAVTPIMTLFVEQIHPQGEYIAFYAGLVVAASGISNLIFAPFIGKVADKIGTSKIIIIALSLSAVIFYLQALSSNLFVLIFLRFLLGIGLGGLLPCINALFKQSVDKAKLGLILGFNQSAFALGNFFGAASGGYLAGKVGIEFVFTSIGIMFLITALSFLILQRTVLSK